MKWTLTMLLLALGLAACGQPTATSEQTIRTYADTIQAGDLTHGVASYSLRDVVQDAIGATATIVWQPADDAKPFCSYVRVRADTGQLEMVKDGTFICPPAAPAKAAP